MLSVIFSKFNPPHLYREFFKKECLAELLRRGTLMMTGERSPINPVGHIADSAGLFLETGSI